MRKGLFLIIVVAAAFAGGAAIQRPELGWAKTILQVRTVDAGPADVPVQDRDGQPSAPEPEKGDEIPSAPPPSLVPDPHRPEAAHAPEPSEVPKTPASTPSSPVAAPKAEPVAGPATPEPLDAKALVAESSRTEALIPPLSVPEESEPTPPPVPAPEPPAPADPKWADAPGLVAETPARVDRAVTPAVLAPEPAEPGQSQGWADLRRRMRELGVRRYWVEGEPNGSARFRCVIPLADGHAVGQQFEAEGRDDLQAAEAALRRVVLWKATESPDRP